MSGQQTITRNGVEYALARVDGAWAYVPFVSVEPAPKVQSKPKSKVAEPVKAMSRWARCGKEIPCDRVFYPNGDGVTNHGCKGFTGTPWRTPRNAR